MFVGPLDQYNIEYVYLYMYLFNFWVCFYDCLVTCLVFSLLSTFRPITLSDDNDIKSFILGFINSITK